MASTAVSFVAETLGALFLGVGSFACARFSPVPGPWLDKNGLVDRGRSRNGDGVRAAKLASRERAEDSIVSLYPSVVVSKMCCAVAGVNSRSCSLRIVASIKLRSRSRRRSNAKAEALSVDEAANAMRGTLQRLFQASAVNFRPSFKRKPLALNQRSPLYYLALDL
jgi:hypothetical protein